MVEQDGDYSAPDGRERLSLFLKRSEISIGRVTDSDLPQCVTLGPQGTYSEQAAREIFQNQVEYDTDQAIKNSDIVRLVKERKFDIGVIPSENSNGGHVTESIRALIHADDLVILGERILPIHQSILGTEAALKKRIVNSHPQGFAQCAKWLDKNVPGHESVPHGSTAGAVIIAKEKDELAIGSVFAGQQYGIPLIEEKAENVSNNTTRFWVIGRGETEPTGDDRTIFALTVKNEPGALARIFNAAADDEVSINVLHPFPLTLDHYYWMLSIDGYKDEEITKRVLARIQESAWKMKVLGSFQKSMMPRVEYELEAYEEGWVPGRGHDDMDDSPPLAIVQ